MKKWIEEGSFERKKQICFPRNQSPLILPYSTSFLLILKEIEASKQKEKKKERERVQISKWEKAEGFEEEESK